MEMGASRTRDAALELTAIATKASSTSGADASATGIILADRVATFREAAPQTTIAYGLKNLPFSGGSLHSDSL